jgi:hypothetical protein
MHIKNGCHVCDKTEIVPRIEPKARVLYFENSRKRTDNPGARGGRGAIKIRMEQIKKRMVQWPAAKVSMMGAVDNGAGIGQ